MQEPENPPISVGKDTTGDRIIDDDIDTKRRDVLTKLTFGAGCAGVCALAYPFLDSLNGTRASAFDESDVVDVDISMLRPGQQKVVQWRNWPVFVQRRTPEALASLQAPGADRDLRDPASRVLQQPRDATNWHRSVVPEIGVYIGICTHLGCVPNYNAPSATDLAGGYVCPCHGSHFDIAGRAFSDAPAPYNLPVPPVTMLSANTLRIGLSKGDPTFDINDIQQI
ncbi:ubiquinol-cytochrome c reductase iron-sulfur subunit [Neoasaia chiangmaiensis NBRC 101099]|uniref:ubiquinol-cytochrome c reductase iron-sulfur subunit n=1 Tax=Neoasaia chiangmaiensis TaxID=320497 RepID=UPI00098AA266|nr:ubiquinol-cytochrome c reductase iron-sulfur subunit [Neoasaia chiangmaiensis]GBR37443.1 ubiquinol-cytochrome c reductase iron-sulfur subunit [Neoasaia chiangmaiensis NBRC 101099]GEN14955.1 ubiquinol-cytochrome c reductase iron-sulfur subunit [Neoasaia chiangmaiensis]